MCSLIFELFLIIIIPSIIARERCGSDINPISDLVFIKVGNYEGVDSCGISYTKEYFIPRFFRARWHEVPKICQSYGMGFASLETKDESQKLLKLVEPYKKETPRDFYVAGMTLGAANRSGWYWINSGNLIDYDLPWVPSQPDGGWAEPEWDSDKTLNEKCLSIRKYEKDDKMLGYNDVFCFSKLKPQKFVCETYKVLDKRRNAWKTGRRTFGNEKNIENECNLQ